MADLNLENYDGVEERMIKVYPYEMPNASKSEEFIGAQTSSIVYITQDLLDVNDEFLLQDENGYKYFEMFAAITSEGKLDLSSSTSTLGQELKEEDSFIALSNWYYEGELENIKIGNARLMPAIFSIGKPFNEKEYVNGEQTVFVPSSMTEAKEGEAQLIDNAIDVEGLYEFTLINTTAIESTFTNSKIYFTNSFDTQSEDIVTIDGNQNGITLGFENHTLINYIKGKGKTDEFSTQGSDEGIEFGEIDFVSKQSLSPFKMTPVSITDKVTMYADWFDYDVAMPFVFAEKFKSGASLSEIITNKDDLKMVEDMLVLSAAFAESFASIKVLASGGDAGKLDPTIRIGHKGIKVSSISNKTPVKVIDGIYEDHIRKFPSYSTDETRYQPVKEVLAALSRYLYTSYSIGKGQNSFNRIYLPWYLEPFGSTGIKFDTSLSIVNPDKGATGNVNTFILSPNSKFQIKSTYFRDKYSDSKNLKPTSTLTIPTSVNLSNIKMAQTDVKLTIPQMPYTLQEIEKLPLPGDINTSTSNSLKYIWYLPIPSQTIFEEFFLDSLTTKGTIAAGTDIPVNIKPGLDGKVWTQQEVNEVVNKQQQGNIKVAPIISNVMSANMNIGGTGLIARNFSSSEQSLLKSLKIVEWVEGISFYAPGPEIKSKDAWAHFVQQVKNYEDLSSINIVNISVDTGDFESISKLLVTYTVSHSEFTQATVTSGGGIVDTYSFTSRQVLFDKQQWKRFLTSFNIVPNTIIDYELLEKEDFKIKQLDEIIIGSCWGNFVELKVNRRLIARIELFNSTDETIGVQRIIFT